MSGLIADSRTMVDKARVESQVGLYSACMYPFAIVKWFPNIICIIIAVVITLS